MVGAMIVTMVGGVQPRNAGNTDADHDAGDEVNGFNPATRGILLYSNLVSLNRVTHNRISGFRTPSLKTACLQTCSPSARSRVRTGNLLLRGETL